MNKYVMILLAFFIYGCSSSTDKKEVSKDVPFYWVDNDDFRPVSEISYDADEDYYEGELEKDNVISVETMAKVEPSKLMDLVDENDPISKPVSLCYQDNFVAAFNKLDRSYREYKNNASFWNQVGTCYLLKGERRKALLYYNKARDMVKGYGPAINNIGVIHFKNGDYEKALSAFRSAYQSNNFSLTPAYNLAMMYLRFGFVSKAEPIIVSLYKKNNADQDVINALAHVYMMKGLYSQAIKAFNQLEDNIIKRPNVGISLSYALAKLGNKERANSIMNDVSQNMKPEFTNYYTKILKKIREIK